MYLPLVAKTATIKQTNTMYLQFSAAMLSACNFMLPLKPSTSKCKYSHHLNVNTDVSRLKSKVQTPTSVCDKNFQHTDVSVAYWLHTILTHQHTVTCNIYLHLAGVPHFQTSNTRTLLKITNLKPSYFMYSLRTDFLNKYYGHGL